MQKESQIISLKTYSEDHEDREETKNNPKLKNAQLIYLWSIGIAMGSFVFGYSLVLTSILGSSIRQHIYSSLQGVIDEKMVSMYLSICTTALPLGALVGSLVYHKFLKAIKSENKSMILCDYITICLYFIQTLSLNPLLIALLRFFIGVFIGISCTIVPMYLKSIAPIQISGKIGSLNQIFITIGIATAYGMGICIDDKNLENEWRWRLCVIIPCFASYLRVITCQKFMYETLQRHIERKNYDILQKYVEEFYISSTYSIQELVKSKKKTDSTSQKSHKKSEKFNQRVLLAIALTIMNQFCGINAIMFYANQLFSVISKGDSKYAVLMSFYMGIFQIVITVISGSLLDKFGRRSLMLLGETVVILSLLSAYYMLDYDAVSGWDSKYASYAIFAHIAGFSLSLGPITIVYLSQILEDISSYMVILWIQTVFVSMTSNILIEQYGVGKVFLFFALISILCFVYVIPTMRETKGKTRNQIQDQFSRPN